VLQRINSTNGERVNEIASSNARIVLINRRIVFCEGAIAFCEGAIAIHQQGSIGGVKVRSQLSLGVLEIH
jgi:hypothetical protein